MNRLSVLGLTAMFLSATFPVAAEEGDGETGEGRFWFFVKNISAESDDDELRLWVAQPVNHRGQDVEIGEIYPEPYEVVEDGLSGNRIIFWRVTDFGGNDGLLFYYDFDYTVYEVNVDVDPAAVEPYDKESEEYTRYTRSEHWIDLTDAIVAKSKEIVGDETNPYIKAGLIFDWVVDNMSYEYPDLGLRGAANSFTRLKGDCGEYSVVFCALCRAQGIPARTVTCVWFDRAGHQWAEFYVPPYGWIPVDASAGDLVEGNNPNFPDEERIRDFMEKKGIPEKNRDYLFGNLYPNRLIVSVGNNIKVEHTDLGLERDFRFLQPGGLFAHPPAFEWDGLSGQPVVAEFYTFGDGCDDLETARERASVEMAVGYLQIGRYEEAEAGFLKKTEAAPEDAMAWLNLGQAYLEQGKLDEAVKAFNNCLLGKGGGIKPVLDVWARNFLGSCYAETGRTDEARAEFEAVLESGFDFDGSLDYAREGLAELEGTNGE
ncbi:MAG: tetratricopeptide repeat protein [Candidatus Coatesbacteria bacterium]|nr:MAG: tetratricopeptide repeat protein [Candidatus Coatesbacteria bacterium]